jgi:hypothetical protein
LNIAVYDLKAPVLTTSHFYPPRASHQPENRIQLVTSAKATLSFNPESTADEIRHTDKLLNLQDLIFGDFWTGQIDAGDK